MNFQVRLERFQEALSKLETKVSIKHLAKYLTFLLSSELQDLQRILL